MIRIRGINYVAAILLFQAGDTCSLKARVFNHSGEDQGELPMFIVLGCSGEYWFYPSWDQDIRVGWFAVHPGIQEISIIDPFAWPRDAGSGSGVCFYGLFTKPDLSKVYGVFDTWEVSWDE